MHLANHVGCNQNDLELYSLVQLFRDGVGLLDGRHDLDEVFVQQGHVGRVCVVDVDAGFGGNLLLRVLIRDGRVHLLVDALLQGVLEHPDVRGAHHDAVVVLQLGVASDGPAVDQDATVLLTRLDGDLRPLLVHCDNCVLIMDPESKSKKLIKISSLHFVPQPSMHMHGNRDEITKISVIGRIAWCILPTVSVQKIVMQSPKSISEPHMGQSTLLQSL